VLSIIVFLPLVAAAICAVIPARRTTWPRWVALAASLADFALVLALTARFVPGGGMQFVERAAWAPQAGIEYHLGVDGLSLPMVFLASLLTVLAVLVSWNTETKPGFWFSMLMLLAVGMNGVFVALDFILFYVFWELVLVPMYFLIGQWGGPRREYAALKFFLYTLLGSVFMLIGIIVMYLAVPHGAERTFNMIEIATRAGSTLSSTAQWWVFAAFFLGFAVKVPVWPLHTWLPDAHVEAPTAASALLAGVLLKMGTYGFMRISLPMLPDAFRQWQTFIAVLAVVSIIYGAFVAFAQADLKKLVAYSSVSHMGFAMLGIASGTAAGLNGAQAVNFSHGLVSAALFIGVGCVYERAHTRQIAEISGLANQIPKAAFMISFFGFASLGLPGLSGFVGEFLSLLGGWISALAPILVILAALGVLFGAAYILWMLRRVVFGQPSFSIADTTDLTAREMTVFAPLVALVVAVGVYWNLLLQYTNPFSVALSRIVGS
jgi:NADH-quinone oxidoreductase subunit M